MKNEHWLIGDVWNKSIETREEKPIGARDHMWASELGRSDLDIYLKLLGTAPTNPFDVRARRKFEAGNLFEWVVELILRRCGIYKESQKWLSDTEFGIEVTGKLDHLAGGVPNYDKGIEELKSLGLPELFTRASEQIMAHFKSRYPNGLPEQVIEVKSTSSYGIEKVYATGKALAGHDLQAFHYAYKEKKNAIVVYISRDDLRMAEIVVRHDDPELLASYKTKIERIAAAYHSRQEPAPEPCIIFDKDLERFTKNYNVGYSPFLTRITGIQSQADFDEKYDAITERWNRVIGRILDKKEMTDNNKAAIAEMSEMGFDIMTLITIKQ